MFTLVRNLRQQSAALIEAPSFFISLVIAETLYKFHSFTLECLAFLATWFAVSAAATGVRRLIAGPTAARS